MGPVKYKPDQDKREGAKRFRDRGVDELKTRNHENHGLGRRLLARDCKLTLFYKKP